MLDFKSQSVNNDKDKRNSTGCQNIQKNIEKPTEFKNFNILNKCLMNKDTHENKEQKLGPSQRLKRKEIGRSIGRSSKNNSSKIGNSQRGKGIDSPCIKEGIDP